MDNDFNTEDLKRLSKEQVCAIIQHYVNSNIKIIYCYIESDIFFNNKIIVTWDFNKNRYDSKGETLKEVIKDIQTKYEEIMPSDPLIPIAQIMETIVGQLKETEFTIKDIEGLKSYFHGINHMNNLIVEKFEKELGNNE
jgi:hypothetical protein